MMKRTGLKNGHKKRTLMILAVVSLIVLGCLETDMLDEVSEEEVKIISPTDPTTVDEGTTVEFVVSIDEAITPRSIIWSSSRDGWIGEGRRMAKSDLSVGIHSILVTVIDSGNTYRPQQTITDSIRLEVVEKEATPTDASPTEASPTDAPPTVATPTEVFTTSFDIHQCDASAAISEVVSLVEDSENWGGRNCHYIVQATNNSDQKVYFYHYDSLETNDQPLSQYWTRTELMPGETKELTGLGVYSTSGIWTYFRYEKLMAIYVNEDCRKNIDYNDENAYQELFAWEIQTYCTP